MKLLAALALFLVYARPADACTCDDPPPACEAFDSAGVVFVGKATTILDGPGGSQEVTFAITEKLKGTSNATETVEGGGMCGTVFQKGKTYVVYAGGSGNKLSSSLCGRTALLDRAKADVAYARSSGKRTTALLEGVVAVHETQGAVVRRAGALVRVRETKLRARTDKTGRYKLALPPGKYTLDVVDPKARVPLDHNEVVTLSDAAACAHRDISLVWNGRVRGRVLGTDGKPAVGVQVTLVATGATRAGNAFATTDAKGNYEHAGIQAGEYTIVIYGTKGVPTTTYYPNVDDAQQAKSIKLVQSGLVQKIDIKLLP